MPHSPRTIHDDDAFYKPILEQRALSNGRQPGIRRPSPLADGINAPSYEKWRPDPASRAPHDGRMVFDGQAKSHFGTWVHGRLGRRCAQTAQPRPARLG
jgi:hypothetical protein